MNILEQLKSISISSVISLYLPLEKRGEIFQTNCPFHPDSNESLRINDKKGIYKCFSCGAGGDVVRFIVEYKKITFMDAVNIVLESAEYLPTKPLIIAVDFDGTIVKHAYPELGAPVPEAISSLKALQSRGHKLMLWTMRSGKDLNAAVEYLKTHGIILWGVNENPDQDWTTSPKQYAHFYIDDAAVGCPLVHIPGEKPFVDWRGIRKLLSV